MNSTGFSDSRISKTYSSIAIVRNPENIKRILTLLTPVSLVSYGRDGYSFQIFQRLHRIYLAIFNKNNELSLLSDKKIHNALIPEESGWELLQRIQHLEPRKWHISFQQEIGHAYIWPYLIAAGGGDNDHPSVDRSKTHSGKSQIQISTKEMHQCGNHFNKHGRGMGFTSKKEYDRAAREFAETHQVNPKAKMVEGILNSESRRA